MELSSSKSELKEPLVTNSENEDPSSKPVLSLTSDLITTTTIQQNTSSNSNTNATNDKRRPSSTSSSVQQHKLPAAPSAAVATVGKSSAISDGGGGGAYFVDGGGKSSGGGGAYHLDDESDRKSNQATVATERVSVAYGSLNFYSEVSAVDLVNMNKKPQAIGGGFGGGGFGNAAYGSNDDAPRRNLDKPKPMIRVIEDDLESETTRRTAARSSLASTIRRTINTIKGKMSKNHSSVMLNEMDEKESPRRVQNQVDPATTLELLEAQLKEAEREANQVDEQQQHQGQSSTRSCCCWPS